VGIAANNNYIVKTRYLCTVFCIFVRSRNAVHVNSAPSDALRRIRRPIINSAREPPALHRHAAPSKVMAARVSLSSACSRHRVESPLPSPKEDTLPLRAPCAAATTAVAVPLLLDAVVRCLSSKGKYKQRILLLFCNNHYPSSWPLIIIACP